MRVIATVMGEPDSTKRNNEVSSMLDYAFAQVGLKKVLSKNSVVEKINLSKSKLDEIKAPLKKGDVVGTLYVMNNDEVINEVDLTVKEDVEKCNLIELYFKYLKNIISGNIKF